MASLQAQAQLLGIVLPEPSTPAANYAPYVLIKGFLFISGQLPIKDGTPLYQGQLGLDVSLEEGEKAAELCALHVLAMAHDAAQKNNLNGISPVFLRGFVASASSFDQHHRVMNGASNMMGRFFTNPHGRAAVGVHRLPLNAAVEVEALFSS